MLLAVSDVVYQALIAAVLAGFLAWIKASVDRSAEKAAVKVAEVKTTLDRTTKAADIKFDELAKVTSATHTLVNSNMSAQLKISSVALHRVAELTNHPDDIKAAKFAEEAYMEHEAKQKIVDSAKV